MFERIKLCLILRSLLKSNWLIINKTNKTKPMKRIVLQGTVLVVLMATVFTACSQKGEVRKGDLKSISDSASYCIGINMGMQMKAEKMDINPEVFMNAFYAAYKWDTANLLIKQAQMQEIMTKYQQAMQEKQKAAAKEKGKVNREKGAKCLAENKTKEIEISLNGVNDIIIEKFI